MCVLSDYSTGLSHGTHQQNCARFLNWFVIELFNYLLSALRAQTCAVQYNTHADTYTH